jgi:uncharacterized protein YbaR (Trm112 family)
MHLSLSDLLTCPRCGPAHGLVLMPEVVRDRRVEAGVLGCPNCRERYAIRGGVAELGVLEEVTNPGIHASEGWDGGWDGEAWAVRLGGLLGLEGVTRGVILVGGPASAGAGRLEGLVEGVEVVVVRRGEAGGGGGGGVRVGVGAGAGVPFRTGSMRGVALTGWATSLAEEGLRVLGPGARLLLEPAGGGVRERVAAAGATVVLDEGETLVVMRGV